MRSLSPRTHGVLDYVGSGVLAAAALIFMAEVAPTAATLSWVIAGAVLLLALVTRYPVGVFKLLPFRAHGVFEVIMAPLMVVLPWLAGFDDAPVARTFFVLAGVSLFAIWVFTDYHAAEHEPMQESVGGQAPPSLDPWSKNIRP